MWVANIPWPSVVRFAVAVEVETVPEGAVGRIHPEPLLLRLEGWSRERANRCLGIHYIQRLHDTFSSTQR